MHKAHGFLSTQSGAGILSQGISSPSPRIQSFSVQDSRFHTRCTWRQHPLRWNGIFYFILTLSLFIHRSPEAASLWEYMFYRRFEPTSLGLTAEGFHINPCYRRELAEGVSRPCRSRVARHVGWDSCCFLLLFDTQSPVTFQQLSKSFSLKPWEPESRVCTSPRTSAAPSHLGWLAD